MKQGYPSLASLPESTRRALNGNPLGPKVRALDQTPHESTAEIERLKLQVDSLSFALQTAVKANAELQNALVLRIGSNDASSSSSMSLFDQPTNGSISHNDYEQDRSSNSFKKMQKQNDDRDRERGRSSNRNGGISPFFINQKIVSKK